MFTIYHNYENIKLNSLSKIITINYLEYEYKLENALYNFYCDEFNPVFYQEVLS